MKRVLKIVNPETREVIKVTIESETDYNSLYEAYIDDTIELRMSGWMVLNEDEAIPDFDEES